MPTQLKVYTNMFKPFIRIPTIKLYFILKYGTDLAEIIILIIILHFSHNILTFKKVL